MPVKLQDDDDRYQLQDPIDRGFLSLVYRGQDRVLNRAVAIKVLREVYSSDPAFVKWFRQEAETVSALQHPNIVQVYDYKQTHDKHYIVMELVQGTNLRRYLHSRGVLAVDRAVIIAHDIALGLGAAHRRGVVHHRVSSTKVLIDRDGSIKLTGFGLPLVNLQYYSPEQDQGEAVLVNLQYYSPEQAQGEAVNAATDVYSLGVVMYEMLTGRSPFDGDTPIAVAMQHIQDLPTSPRLFNPNIPSSLEEVIMRCLEKKPEMRFRDGTQLARALENL